LARKQKNEVEEEIDLDKTVVRCERQTLHRLPKTGALVFAFKVILASLEGFRWSFFSLDSPLTTARRISIRCAN
jgi:hypothetical protein